MLSRPSLTPRMAASIVTPSGPADFHRDLIITLAARHKLPAVYFERAFVDGRRTDLVRAQSD